MLRALLLMMLLRYTSMSKWAENLRAKPRLARIAGFEPFDTPVAGSFYHCVYYGCPVKRSTHRKDQGYIYINHVDECPLGVLCQPDTKHGPVVYIKTNDDPGLPSRTRGAVSTYTQSISQIQEADESQNRMRTVKLHQEGSLRSG